jgi:hypothetical protein
MMGCGVGTGHSELDHFLCRMSWVLQVLSSVPGLHLLQARTSPVMTVTDVVSPRGKLPSLSHLLTPQGPPSTVSSA